MTVTIAIIACLVTLFVVEMAALVGIINEVHTLHQEVRKLREELVPGLLSELATISHWLRPR